ncbi:MAG: GNAT family N-acetyltransferase [Defluviitaleaceae bacterium]|nr:GNAT family N-acetyltransferase [Defluviitaleaceae bacterium]
MAEVHGIVIYENAAKGSENTEDGTEATNKSFERIAHIRGFFVHTPNAGFGTILMDELIQYAKKHNSTKITGRLSSVDEKFENTDRRNHFYKKFGFEFLDNDKICLDLRQGQHNNRHDISS